MAEADAPEFPSAQIIRMVVIPEYAPEGTVIVPFNVLGPVFVVGSVNNVSPASVKSPSRFKSIQIPIPLA